MAALEYPQLEIPLILLDSVLEVSRRNLLAGRIVLVSKPVASVCSRRAAAPFGKCISLNAQGEATSHASFYLLTHFP